MKPVHYVILNPSGNLTALVTDHGGPEDEKEIVTSLMRESEQVAFLDPPLEPGALARIRLMGGEFCGNAAMAAAGWLIRDSLRNGQVMTVPIEVSGAQGIVFCKIRGLETGFEGTVDMPQVLGISRQNVSGTDVTEVRMEGITHLIRESCEPIGKEEAETLLMAYAERSQDPAAGLLDRNPETGFVRPLGYVRGSGTLVWENAWKRRCRCRRPGSMAAGVRNGENRGAAAGRKAPGGGHGGAGNCQGSADHRHGPDRSRKGNVNRSDG